MAEVQDLIPGAGAASLAVDATHIYWSAQEGASIARANLDGTGVELAWVTTANDSLFLSGGFIYFRHEGVLGRVAVDGTGLEPEWWPAAIPFPEVADWKGESTYATGDYVLSGPGSEEKTLYRSLIDDNKGISPATSPEQWRLVHPHLHNPGEGPLVAPIPLPEYILGGYAYFRWTEQLETPPNHEWIARVPLAATALEAAVFLEAIEWYWDRATIDLSESVQFPSDAIATDGTRCYFLGTRGAEEWIVGYFTPGNAAVVFPWRKLGSIIGQPRPGELAVAGEHIYWVEYHTHETPRIGRMLNDGTKVEPNFLPLTSQPGGVTGRFVIAVDQTYLYWVDGETGDIMRTEHSPELLPPPIFSARGRAQSLRLSGLELRHTEFMAAVLGLTVQQMTELEAEDRYGAVEEGEEPTLAQRVVALTDLGYDPFLVAPILNISLQEATELARA